MATHFRREPLWYKDAVIYQVHVKSFCDSRGKGTGDFKGLTEKLDYIRDLGATALWLMPFYPSPMLDDGYDISDYLGVNPEFGTLEDFRAFLDAAHFRGLYVITELIINHTSDKHAWFQAARKAAPGSAARERYVWSDTADRYDEARIIFRDFETSNWSWDEEAKAFYWHRFYSHQPDLNFDNPQVHQAVLDVLDFWLEMGVDGLRLDAIPYLYEREGTNCENLPETHAFLQKLSAHVREKFSDRMLLAEANQWPEDSAAYFGAGKECDMAFHFPVMPRLYMAVEMQDAFPVVDILQQTPEIPSNCQWAIFLRNHDELTLEMVSDEERDYMYRVYAKDNRARINLGIRRRLVPLLGNDRRKFELLNSLLLSLPGTPVIYYGDEIGMGDNIDLGDRNGVRTPMQWNAGLNAGFSGADPNRLFLPVIQDSEYDANSVNVEKQERNPHSLLWWMRKRIAVRRQMPVFGRGETHFPHSDNNHVLVFLRKHEGETVLVAANLAGQPQAAQIDLAEYAGEPVQEIVGHARFPWVTRDPYALTLGAHECLWLRVGKGAGEKTEIPLPELEPCDRIEECLSGQRGYLLAHFALPHYLAQAGLIPEENRHAAIRCHARIRLDIPDEPVLLLMLEAGTGGGQSRRFCLPVAFVADTHPTPPPRDAWMARVHLLGQAGHLVDAAHLKSFRAAALNWIATGAALENEQGSLIGLPVDDLKEAGMKAEAPMTSQLIMDRSRTIFLFPELCVLRFFRELSGGISPDVIMTRFLAEKTSFRNAPVYLGSLEWHGIQGEMESLGMLQSAVPTDRDARHLANMSVLRYTESLRASADLRNPPPWLPTTPLPMPFEEMPEILQNPIGGAFAEFAQLLGLRTAELHLALASRRDVPGFEPEPFTAHHLAELHQTLRSRLRRETARRRQSLPRAEVTYRSLLDRFEEKALAWLREIFRSPFQFERIRVHGDLNLSQALFTGKDFIFRGFGTLASTPPGYRGHKHPALRDLAGMLHSFRQAALACMKEHRETWGHDAALLEPWLHAWSLAAGNIFLEAYLAAAEGAGFLPNQPGHFILLLKALLLDQGIVHWSREAEQSPEEIEAVLISLSSLFEPES